MIEKSDFFMTPKDLAEKLKKSQSIQSGKTFDVFISHSSIDASNVRNIIHALNKQGYVCYCDWTSDNDFLKREMVSEYTKEVLKRRMIQSSNFLLVKSKNSDDSEWVQFEIEYYSKECNKSNMYVISNDSSNIELERLPKLVFK